MAQSMPSDPSKNIKLSAWLTFISCGSTISLIPQCLPVQHPLPSAGTEDAELLQQTGIVERLCVSETWKTIRYVVPDYILFILVGILSSEGQSYAIK